MPNDNTTPNCTEITVCQIEASATSAIRHRVLWPSIPLENQLLPFDTLPSTSHYGAFLPSARQEGSGSETASQSTSASLPEESQLIAVLTITLEQFSSPSRLPESIRSLRQYQLHKFAVLPAYQGRGIGRTLLTRSIQALSSRLKEAKDGKKEGKFLFHFDARSLQMEFYRHLGFEVLIEETFMKYGSTGKEKGVEYVKMGGVVQCTETEVGKGTHA